MSIKGLFDWGKGVVKDNFDKQAEEARKKIADIKTADTWGRVTVEVIAGNAFIPTGQVTIIKGNEPRRLQFNFKGERKTYLVSELTWGEKKESNPTKAAATAVVGGALIGGLEGILIGGAIGAKKQDNSVATITLEVDGFLQPLYVRCTGTDYETISKMLHA